MAKKVVVYKKGVKVAFLKAHNQMKKQVKAGKIDWSNLELSNEEEDDQGSGEISSNDDELAGGAEEAEQEVQPETTLPAPVLVNSQGARSEQPTNPYDAAMIVSYTDGAWPNGTAREGTSGTSGGGQEV